MMDAPPDEAAISAKASSAMGWVIIGGVIGPSMGGLAPEMAGALTDMLSMGASTIG